MKSRRQCVPIEPIYRKLILEKIVYHALQKSKEKRYKMGLNIAADLSLSFDYLEKPEKDIDIEEKMSIVRSLEFFSEFSEAELWEILRACAWHEYEYGTEIIVEGDIDDSFYIISSGAVEVFKDNQVIGLLQKSDCFGEMGYLAKTERSATIIAQNYVQLMKINSTLIDQISVECQLHFSKVFLKTLVRRRLSDTTAMYASLSNAQ
jgi:signal-transduction protein with cAMP-binding, CBS, and nucleotidyltransferase domain